MAPDEVQYLLDLVGAAESNQPQPVPPDFLSGALFDPKAWESILRYAFLAFEYFYAYNDWERYQVALWDNEHEGDDEGCCLVFDRRAINVAARAGDDALRRVVPSFLITCVHEEKQRADEFVRLSAPIPPEDDPGQPPAETMNLSVYVAGGSHATDTTMGDDDKHDTVDFGDMVAYLPQALWLTPSVAVTLLLLGAMIECLQDTEDFTSDDGVHSGPRSEDVRNDLVVLPMSRANNIFQDRHTDLLRLRTYAGKWGANDGIIDHSPRMEAKTARYLRQLLRKA